MSTILPMYSVQSSPLFSFQPMKGETNREPFLAAISACDAENTSVRFVRTPFFSNRRAAAIPASVQGILMTKLLHIAAIFSAMATMSSALSRCGSISTEIGNPSQPSMSFSFTKSASSPSTV